jgi:nucleotide-binding universal stress UspA family protein
MNRTVLSATDFSADARQAAERAALLCAAGAMAGSTLLHVMQASWLDSVRRLVKLPAEAEAAMLAEATAKLGHWASEIGARTGFVPQTGVRIGSVVDTLLREAEEHELLALGARGRHPLRDFALGTTAEHLLRRTRKPLLVVRRPAASGYRRVLVALDFSPHSRTALEWAVRLGPLAEVHALHVFEMPFEGMMHYSGVDTALVEQYRREAHAEATGEMRRFIADTRHRPSGGCIPRSPAASTSPARCRNGRSPSMPTWSWSASTASRFAEQLLLGSVTLHLLAQCPCDVLVAQ